MQSSLEMEARPGDSRALHRFLVFLSGATLLLIVAGALVTSNDAGLSVPDWPTSFGSFRMPPMVGGVLYEHGHRMVAASIGFLTIILTIWILRKERRGWMRKLAVVALLAVITQGILGGVTVRFFLPPAISTIHACLAQLFFALLVSMSVFTSRSWNQSQPRLEDFRSFSLRSLCLGAVGAILLQLFLGAAFRHHWFTLIPHFVGALLVSVMVVWTVVVTFRRHGKQPDLIRPALWASGLLLVQLVLGTSAYFLLSANAREPQPMPAMISVTVAHVAVGALTLAAILVLTWRVLRRLIPQQQRADVPTLARSAMT